jgi:ribosome modulation factor
MKDETLLPDIALKFNIEHPDVEECYLFGYECGLSDISENANPFRLGTSNSDHWLEGWWAGFYGESPLFQATVHRQEMDIAPSVEAINDETYATTPHHSIYSTVLKITGAIAASALVGYQLLELVA